MQRNKVRRINFTASPQDSLHPMSKSLEEYRFEIIKFMVDLGAKAASLYFVSVVACLTLYSRFASSGEERVIFSSIGLISCLAFLFMITGVLMVVEIVAKQFLQELSVRLNPAERIGLAKQSKAVMYTGRVMFVAGLTANLVLGFLFSYFLFDDRQILLQLLGF